MAGRIPKVVAAVQDPGAANCIAPVAERLRADGKTVVTVIGLDFAGDVLRRRGVPFKHLGDYGLDRVDIAAAERILAAERPDMILIGTSEDLRSLDRVLTLRARDRGIAVVSVVDYWSNYTSRFSGVSEDQRLLYLPDIICLMDQRARDEMVAEGFPPERLFVSGHPYLGEFSTLVARQSAEERARFRRGLGVPEGSRLITFASETFGWTHDSSYRFPPLSGSRERTVLVLEHLLRALTEVVQRDGARLFVVNKLHPKNRPEEFRWLEAAVLPFVVRTVETADNISLIQVSDLVVGMTSMFLLEASLLGVPTLHIVPRSADERVLPGGARGHRVARTPAELRDVLRNLLAGGMGADDRNEPEGLDLAGHRGAVARVTAKMYEMLGVGNGIESGG